jgi:hypothetical protein
VLIGAVDSSGQISSMEPSPLPDDSQEQAPLFDAVSYIENQEELLVFSSCGRYKTIR